MRIFSAFLAAALLAVAAPAAAQSGYGQSGYAPHYERHTDRHPDWRREPAYGNRGSSCPNGDCRGLNSPGNLGGAPGDF